MIVWEDKSGSSYQVYAKIYNADHTIRKSEFNLSSSMANDISHYEPNITQLENGSIVVAWHNNQNYNDLDYNDLTYEMFSYRRGRIYRQ